MAERRSILFLERNEKAAIKRFAAKLDTISIPLSGAILCLDCDVLYNSDFCPRCMGKNYFRLVDYLPPMNTNLTPWLTYKDKENGEKSPIKVIKTWQEKKTNIK